LQRRDEEDRLENCGAQGIRMTTLRTMNLADFSAEEQAVLERVARRMGQTSEQLLKPGIFGVQAHWPAWLEANVDHALATYLARGTLPPLAKEAMHVAVSMTNHCEY
jgi:alkylhydroperoxidase family enzyme